MDVHVYPHPKNKTPENGGERAFRVQATTQRAAPTPSSVACQRREWRQRILSAPGKWPERPTEPALSDSLLYALWPAMARGADIRTNSRVCPHRPTGAIDGSWVER